MEAAGDGAVLGSSQVQNPTQATGRIEWGTSRVSAEFLKTNKVKIPTSAKTGQKWGTLF